MPVVRFDFLDGMPVYINLDDVAAVVPVDGKVMFMLKSGKSISFDDSVSVREHVMKAMDRWANLPSQLT